DRYWQRRSIGGLRSCSFPHSLIPSFPHSLIPSFPHSLIPSFPHSLIPSFPHSLPNEQPNRRRVVRIAGIVELRTVRDQADDVHLRAQLDILTGRGDAVFERQLAF